MSIFHCNIKAITKGSNRSVVQFGAYIDGEEDKSLTTGQTYDHTSKEEVKFSQMYFTADVPERLQNRSKFWNEVEKDTDRANGRLAKAYEIAFPTELSYEQCEELAKKYAKDYLQDKRGYSAVQVAIHWKEKNPHMHLLVPINQMKKGKWEKIKEVLGYLCKRGEEEKVFKNVGEINAANAELKTGKWERIPLIDPKTGKQKTDAKNRLQWKRKKIVTNERHSRQAVIDDRAAWAEMCNEYLAPEQQISHLSYKDQGIDKIATKHLGSAAAAMESRGEYTEIGDYNRAVEITNACKEMQLEIGDQTQYLQQLEHYILLVQEAKRRKTIEEEKQKEVIMNAEERAAADELEAIIRSSQEYNTRAAGDHAEAVEGDLGSEISNEAARANDFINAARVRSGDLDTIARQATFSRADRDAERERLRTERSRQYEITSRADNEPGEEYTEPEHTERKRSISHSDLTR